MELQWNNAWGYHSAATLESFSEQAKTAVEASEAMNAMGYLLSPIIGVIRLIANTSLLCYPQPDISKKYVAAQIVRSILEIMCLGIFLSVIDIAFTCQRKPAMASRA